MNALIHRGRGIKSLDFFFYKISYRKTANPVCPFQGWMVIYQNSSFTVHQLHWWSLLVVALVAKTGRALRCAGMMFNPMSQT